MGGRPRFLQGSCRLHGGTHVSSKAVQVLHPRDRFKSDDSHTRVALLSFAGKWEDLRSDSAGAEGPTPAPPKQPALGTPSEDMEWPGGPCGGGGSETATTAKCPQKPGRPLTGHPRSAKQRSQQNLLHKVWTQRARARRGRSLHRCSLPPSWSALRSPSELRGCLPSICHLHWVPLVVLESKECSPCPSRSPTPCRNSVPDLA